MVINSAYSVLPLSSAVLVFLLGLFIWLKNTASKLNILFFLYSLTITVWMFGTFMMFNAAADANKVFWDRIVYLGVVIMPILLYHFGLLYCEFCNKQRIILIIGYLLAAIFVPISQLSDKFISGLYTYQWGVHTVARDYHHIFLFYFFFYLIAFFVNLVRHFRAVTGERKKQVGYILFGYGILYGIGPLAFLPAYGIPIHPVIFLCAVPFAIFLAYAVIKHQAMEIKAITAEVLVAFVNVVVFSHIFFPGTATDITVRIVVASVVLVVSLLAIRAVHGEIKQREKLVELDILRQHNEKLMQLDHQKTEFLNIAAHQLRTPVSIINNYVAMLEDGDFGEVSAEVKQVHKNIGESNGWLVRLADEFLNIAHLEQGETKYHMTHVSISALVQTVVKELQPKAVGKGLKLAADFVGDVPQVKLDEEKIRQVIFNYVDNAIKYSTSGEIKISVGQKDGGVFVEVSDTGMGFDAADHANLFQKFRRGKNASQVEVNTSTGLGLYICRKFVEGHAGKVWASSGGVGEGSVFGFWLPV